MNSLIWCYDMAFANQTSLNLYVFTMISLPISHKGFFLICANLFRCNLVMQQNQALTSHHQGKKFYRVGPWHQRPRQLTDEWQQDRQRADVHWPEVILECGRVLQPEYEDVPAQGDGVDEEQTVYSETFPECDEPEAQCWWQWTQHEPYRVYVLCDEKHGDAGPEQRRCELVNPSPPVIWTVFFKPNISVKQGNKYKTWNKRKCRWKMLKDIVGIDLNSIDNFQSHSR